MRFSDIEYCRVLILPFQFQALDCLRQKAAYFSRSRHHCTRHRLAQFIIGRSGLLCTCKVGFRSMSAPGDSGACKQNQFPRLRIDGTFQIFKAHEYGFLSHNPPPLRAESISG